MSGKRPGHPVLTWGGVVAVTGATGVGAVALIRSLNLGPPPTAARTAGLAEAEALPVPGIRAELGAAELAVERGLPALAFSLDEGQSLDPRLPAGPFRGNFRATFHPGPVRRATVGAEFAGGALVIERDGTVLASGQAGAAPAVIESGVEFFPDRLHKLTYRFRADGSGRPRLRALWRPDGAAVPVALPAAGTALFGDEAEAGLSLIQTLNCAACHESGDSALQALLAAGPAPLLGEVGARARPSWIRSWISGPRKIKPDAAMPALLGAGADDERVEDLTHFLASLGGPLLEAAAPDQDLVETGRALYHSAGCFACHGPRDAPSDASGYNGLGDVAAKYSRPALVAFLRDPVALRPAGRMPSQNLTELEAEAVASYLIAAAEGGHGPASLTHGTHATPGTDPGNGPASLAHATGAFTLDPQRAERGRARFAGLGCASCHSLGPQHESIVSELRAPSLEQVAAATFRPGPLTGCLADAPPPGAPDYGLGAAQRRPIVAFLQGVPKRRSHDVPHERLAATLDRLQCLRCHEFHGHGGPAPEAAARFKISGEIDLGDEGRFPPPLTDAGARLDAAWLRRVLEESGAARPYMQVRMPQFGAPNVEALPALLATAAGVETEPDHGPAFDGAAAEAGRALVGSTGFNCIQCHSIAGRASIDLPGPDLARMPERLRSGYFEAWMHDPKLFRATTRMPSFFLAGQSGLLEHFGGDASRQIAAMWMYLSQGEELPLPEGLPDPTKLLLRVEEEPMVFRTFMKDVGARAVACGFPEQVHCAFDAERCELRLAWSGRFLSAAGAWMARGGTETNPLEEPAWKAPPTSLFGPRARRFRGYRLDADRRPVFLYEISAGDLVVAVSEQPVPIVTEERRSLERRFELRGPPGAVVPIDLAGQGAPRTEVAEQGLVLDADGRGRLVLELAW